MNRCASNTLASARLSTMRMPGAGEQQSCVFDESACTSIHKTHVGVQERLEHVGGRTIRQNSWWNDATHNKLFA